MTTLSLLPNSRRPEKSPPARVGELAVLPVFLKLRGKKALVAGGSDAAAWKAELLAASGAKVHIYAQTLTTTFKALIAGAPDKYTHHPVNWSKASFSNCVVAIGDAETEAEANEFFTTAKQKGVPVNTIDRPAFCTFQFGSIVNRSPAIIAISTDGAAPILGQAIRRKIETLLPLSLADWAKLAAKVRGSVNTRLKSAHQRRVFWDHLAKRAFGQAPHAQAEQELIAQTTRIKSTSLPETGRVTFVGAGPGDAELLTLKAVRALQSADIILFDDAISVSVLELARREAKRLLVGEDTQTMVTLAKSGKHVVRLMVGDAANTKQKLATEAMLAKQQIRFETVPGIATPTDAQQNLRKSG